MRRGASEKSKKRMKIADLKAFVETKLLSKSDKALEKIGQEENSGDDGHLLSERSVSSKRIMNVCISIFLINHKILYFYLFYYDKRM